MYTTTKLIAGVAVLSSLVAAIPIADNSWSGWPGNGGSSGDSSSGSDNAQGGAAPVKSGNPFSFPLSDGFPTLSPAALNATFLRAHGTEPNGGAPTLAADDLTSIRLIAFNEIFELAFFTSVLYNITNDVPGFTFQDQHLKRATLEALTAIQAQEELHADNANKILKANKVDPILPCQYKFPTSDLAGALSLAQTFTDVVLGTLQDVQLKLAQNGDVNVVPIIGSVIGQEGQQDGWFRASQGKIPSAQPFLTRSTREFAFSALNQNFIVPGSCSNSNTISLPIFTPLTVNTSPVAPKDQTISYSIPIDKAAKPSDLNLVLINGQNKPLVQQIMNAQISNGAVTFNAYFPYSENVLDGLTIAAVTNSAGPFANAEEVAKATVAGPGLIEVL